MLDIEKLLNELTLEENAGLCSGADQWYTKAVERLGIPALRLSDGPHGLRYIEEGKARQAVCFPTGSALASSFDITLAKRSVWPWGGRLRQRVCIHFWDLR